MELPSASLVQVPGAGGAAKPPSAPPGASIQKTALKSPLPVLFCSKEALAQGADPDRGGGWSP